MNISGKRHLDKNITSASTKNTSHKPSQEKKKPFLPSDSFTTLKPRNTSIDVSVLQQICKSTDFKIKKLGKVGRTIKPNRAVLLVNRV